MRSLRNGSSPEGWKADRCFVDNFADQRPERRNCRRFENCSRYHQTKTNGTTPDRTDAAPRFDQRRNHRPRSSRPDRLLEPRRGGNVRLLGQRSARKTYARAATDNASGKFKKDSKKFGAR